MKLKSFLNINFVKIITFSMLFSLNSRAEIIENRNEETNFGDWKLYCEIDDMMSLSHCKIASKFYDNSSVISLQPTPKFANEFFIIIPKIKIGSFAKIRVDQNDLVLSGNVSKQDFGMLPIEQTQKNILFNQMKKGDNLFLRFNVADSEKEITIRLKLNDFNKALNQYNNKVFQK